MNAEKMMRAIGSISDRHIVEFAVIKPVYSSKNKCLKIISIAACFAIVIGACNILLRFINLPTDDKVPVIQACVINNEYYELITDEKLIESRGLPKEITEDMLGDYVGICRFEGNSRIGKAYDYLGYEGNSVLILELDSRYYYLFFCNLMDNDIAISMSNLMEKYGVLNNVTSITINGESAVSDIDDIVKKLIEMKALTGNEFENNVFNGKTAEEKREITDKMMYRKEIVISGTSADTLILVYYPVLGYAYDSNTYYEVTSEIRELLQ